METSSGSYGVEVTQEAPVKEDGRYQFYQYDASVSEAFLGRKKATKNIHLWVKKFKVLVRSRSIE